MRLRSSLSGTKGAVAALALLMGCGGQSELRSDHGSSGGPTDSVGGNGVSAAGGNGISSAGDSAVSHGGATFGQASGGTGRAGAPTGSGGSSLGYGGRGGQGTGGGLGERGGQSGGGAGANGGSEPSATAGSAGGPSTGGTPSGGTSSEAPPEPLPPATWDTLKLVLTGTIPPCTGSACHGGTGGKIGLGLPVKNDAQLYSALTTHIVKDCGGIPVVTPGAPEESALIKVLKAPCSMDVERMPKGCTDEQGNCVPPEYIAALEQWIADGAPHP